MSVFQFAKQDLNNFAFAKLMHSWQTAKSENNIIKDAR